MSAQTSYSLAQAKAYAGGIFALATNEISSRSVEGVAGFGFGVAVSRGTNKEKQAIAGGATGFLGITVRDLSREGAVNTGDIQYNETETAGIMRRGSIWAICPTGATPGDPVKYINSTGVLDSGVAVAGETQLEAATWETTTVAGELGVIRIEASVTSAGS